MQKLYVYVDESGQDVTSKFFVVVTVVIVNDQDMPRQKLLEVESLAKTHALKWQKTRHDRRIKYLTFALERKIAAGSVFIGRYPKPVPYFIPTASVIERAITHMAVRDYIATVRVDGINKKIALALTNALRANGISLRMVKSKTDQGEPLIRLADMWAGCIRSALLHERDSLILFQKALQAGYLQEVTT